MLAEHKIENFIAKVNLGVSWFLDAGKLLVDMLDEDPGAMEKIVQYRKGWITLEVLQTFEMIGRGQLAVEAMFLPKHVLNRLIELPVGEQVAIATRPVTVVTGHRNGHARRTEKPACHLTRREAARAIGPIGVRPVAEQAQLLTPNKPFKSHGVFWLQFKNGKHTLTPVTCGKNSLCQTLRLNDNGIAQIELLSPAVQKPAAA